MVYEPEEESGEPIVTTLSHEANFYRSPLSKSQFCSTNHSNTKTYILLVYDDYEECSTEIGYYVHHTLGGKVLQFAMMLPLVPLIAFTMAKQ